MSRSFTSFFVVLFSLFFMASASPMRLVAKAVEDVFVPQIIKPDSSTVWIIGTPATVFWDVSDAPASISNGASVLLNGYGTLAQGFDLRAGNVTFIVPFVTPGTYIITLFGDSGNYSPPFTITN